ncbi:Arginine metabolism regulation protein II [Cyphellophora attinorum]|uniref:Arginine metabolism regulation protein II n=1 Tax=Cyphellophora attinorum TaxID=1664694 RepID=A0A0N1HH65_9EURO|nr:Arginine metabolism regulation protein II [Phialophora attinorum]KPI35014.1 Arginine metabolism regulation protein II [Phialophora attinorum]
MANGERGQRCFLTINIDAVRADQMRELEATKLMCHLTENSSGADVNDLLDQLEQAAEEEQFLRAGNDRQFTIGPYSVFSTIKAPKITVAELDPNDVVGDDQDPPTTPTPFATLNPYSDPYTFHTGLSQYGTDSSQGALLYDDSDFFIGHETFDFSIDPAVNLPLSSHSPKQVNPHNQALSTPFNFNGEQEQQTEIELDPWTSPQLCSSPSSSPYLPSNVRFLLNHYATHVIDSLTSVPLPKERSPWRGLHLSCAMTAYGEMDVLDEASTTVKDSGSFRQAMESAQHWSGQAQKFRNIGRVAFRKHLESIDASHKPKYKESLMAAMSLVCVGIMSGDVWDSRFYILQCENIIRKLGGNKTRFSKKALQLHRIFAFISILERTTFFQTETEYGELLEDNECITSEAGRINCATSAQQDLVVNLSRDNESRLTVHELKLDIARDAGFETFSGIPGTLFDMLATTNTLIEKIGARALRGTNQYSIPIDLLDEVAQLEHTICNYETESASSCRRLDFLQSSTALAYLDTDEAAADSSSVMAFSMRNAIYNALLVYFFREIRNTNAKILQHYVKKVIVCLETHQKVKSRHYSSNRIGLVVWPSFIVACEALSADLRSRAIACIGHAVEAGFKNGEIAQTVVREVWRQRDAGDANVSWREIVRRSGVFMLLT